MRKVSATIAGEELELPVTFDAGTKLEAAGYDPLRTALKAKRLTSGEYPLTSLGVIVVLYIGAKAAGSKKTREEIGQAVFDEGVLHYLPVAVNYLAAFVQSEPEFPVPKAGDDPNAPAA